MSLRSTLRTLLPLLTFITVTPEVVFAQPVAIFSRAAIGQANLQDNDKSNLPAAIAGIVGSWVIFDALVVLLILFVGRRYRRAAQASNYSLHMVMLQPVAKPPVSTDPSPVSGLTGDTVFPSPEKARGWNNMSWNSVASIDESVVSADRRKAQGEMEALYAAVMEHDAKKGYTSSSSVEESPQSPVSSVAYPSQSPRNFSLPQHQTPLSPVKELTSPTKSRTSARLSKISNLSIFNPSSRSSTSSNKFKSPRFSIRKLPISPPMGSPDIATAASYGENQPLTPRYYNPGPPPTAPLERTYSDRAYEMQPTSQTSQSRAPAPTPLNLNTASLPFRAFNPPQSAPPTKTTILERPAHLTNAPRTGIPTPYSPYMPFTPVTPITPSRMVTKKEKRRNDKINGLRVLSEDDMVKSDEEMWQ